MAAPRKKKRKYGHNDNAFSFARQFTLAQIGAGNDPAHDFVEPAWDGHRVLATRTGTETRLAAIDFRDWTATFPQIARALGRLASAKLAIDGVVCVLDERGAPSFERLRSAVAKTTHVTSAVLICWDLLWDGDDDLRGRPLAERRARLATLLAGAPQPLMPSEALPETVERVLAAAQQLGLRGVVARSTAGDYTAAWHAHAAGAEPVDFRRSLSPPPPLSNADKVLYPRDGLCKRDLAGYYRDVAPVMLPYLLDRPIVVQRWPDGIDEFDWYQHRMPPRAPDYLRAAWVDGVRRIVIENGDALLWMVNQAGLTYHAFGSRLAAIAEPDWAMIDLDPGDRSSWFAELIEVALAVRRTLELLELPSVVKTSGQRGLHILVPLAPGHTFDDAEALGRGIATLLVKLLPDKVTLENEKDRRGGKLLVDHKQFMAKTLVAPYSLRAADGATVSTPIAWSEVSRALDPKQFTLRTVRARLDKHGDLAAPLVGGRGASLAQALAQLQGR
ncbi:MAG TPA: non-homologous end-joining DNA ligase [Kofleriaceae bacterium]|nr:non-homologous end-joining DNA ligase [Kofleriaceae bacterium]